MNHCTDILPQTRTLPQVSRLTYQLCAHVELNVLLAQTPSGCTLQVRYSDFLPPRVCDKVVLECTHDSSCSDQRSANSHDQLRFLSKTAEDTGHSKSYEKVAAKLQWCTVAQKQQGSRSECPCGLLCSRYSSFLLLSNDRKWPL